MESLCFDDVLLVPNFSHIKSRKDVVLDSLVGDEQYNLPVISANMDTVTSPELAREMLSYGAAACLHRFKSIDENMLDFKNSCIENKKPWVSLGLGNQELERAEALYNLGATVFVIDVAHGANIEVVNQFKKLEELTGSSNIIVGNFATGKSIEDFIYHLGKKSVSAFKVGIGGGSACTTRIVTGVGVPTLASVMDCTDAGYPVIADGGIRNSGDIAKCLAAGASMVMIGKMLAGSKEAPSEEVFTEEDSSRKYPDFKRYRGSASQESYVVQNKIAEWRSAEGESFLIPYTGPVINTLQQISGGLKSSFSYLGASNLKEFVENADFIKITSNGVVESRPHGKY